MKFMKKVKAFCGSKAAKAAAALSVAGAVLVPFASAEDTTSAPDVAASVQTSLSGIQNTVLIVLASAAGLGIVIFGFFLAWHYGKRIFKTVAK